MYSDTKSINRNKNIGFSNDKLNNNPQPNLLNSSNISYSMYNNDMNNLKVLCPNCHSLTKTYKNIGSRTSARTWRSKKAS